jgi:hypothetical protein
VHQPLHVRGAQGLGHGDHHREGHVHRQRPTRAIEIGREVLALQQLLHDEGEAPLVLVDVDDLDDVRVPHEVSELRLTQEAGSDVLAACQAGQQDLDGHLAPHQRVGRAIDLAHATHGNARVELVFPAYALSAAIRRRRFRR